MAKPHPFNVEKQLKMYNFFFYKYPFLIIFTDGATEKIRKLQHHFPRLARIPANQSAYGIEAIEQEMGLKLLSQLIEFSIRGHLFCFVLSLQYFKIVYQLCDED